jgi:hypothetical protein
MTAKKTGVPKWENPPPPPPKKKKKRPSGNASASKRELINRTTKVAELLMQGLTGDQIWHYASEKLKWKISLRSIWRYIKAANEEFTKTAQAKHSEEFGKALRRLNFLFASCLKIQDYKGALAMQREINEMMGFRNKYEIKADIKTEELDLSKLSKEQKEQLAAISRKLRADG